MILNDLLNGSDLSIGKNCLNSLRLVNLFANWRHATFKWLHNEVGCITLSNSESRQLWYFQDVKQFYYICGCFTFQVETYLSSSIVPPEAEQSYQKAFGYGKAVELISDNRFVSWQDIFSNSNQLKSLSARKANAL